MAPSTSWSPTAMPSGHQPRPGRRGRRARRCLRSCPAPHPALFRARTHGFVDFSEDVSSKDLVAAVKEGYESVELAKRYTTATMGPAQGKLETVNAVAVIAEATGRTIGDTGTTVWRPPHVPISLGALAGRTPRTGPLFAHAALARSPRSGTTSGRTVDPPRALRRPGRGSEQCTRDGRHHRRDPARQAGPERPRRTQAPQPFYVNKWSKLEVGAVRYGVMCADDGVVFDDGVTGRLGEDHYLMSTTSSGAAAVFEWVENWLQTACRHWRVHVTPVTTAFASINVAGPRRANCSVAWWATSTCLPRRSRTCTSERGRSPA